MPDFRVMIEGPAYDFLREDERLRGRILLLGLSGSHGYGTSREGSDVDFRGAALQRPSDLLGLTGFEQYVDEGTDTVIYGFNKLVRLLLECNPGCCELLGLPRENYLMLSPLGEELLANRRIFLSRRAFRSFGGYAGTQLRRLQNALARGALPPGEKEKHILRSVQNAMEEFARKNPRLGEGSFRLYLGRAVTPGMETEIFVDASYRGLPLREYGGMLDALRGIVRDYDRLGRRPEPRDAEHLNKHAMHLVRLLMTAIDILDKQEIITCRLEERPLLMKIRNGGFMQPDGTMAPDFYEMVAMYERKLEEAAAKTALPDEPDLKKVGAFVERVNRRALKERL